MLSWLMTFSAFDGVDEAVSFVCHHYFDFIFLLLFQLHLWGLGGTSFLREGTPYVDLKHFPVDCPSERETIVLRSTWLLTNSHEALL